MLDEHPIFFLGLDVKVEFRVAAKRQGLIDRVEVGEANHGRRVPCLMRVPLHLNDVVVDPNLILKMKQPKIFDFQIVLDGEAAQVLNLAMRFHAVLCIERNKDGTALEILMHVVALRQHPMLRLPFGQHDGIAICGGDGAGVKHPALKP